MLMFGLFFVLCYFTAVGLMDCNYRKISEQSAYIYINKTKASVPTKRENTKDLKDHEYSLLFPS